MKKCRITFPAVMQMIVTVMLMILIGVAIFALMACLERDDFENAITVAGVILIMVPVTIVFVRTKF